MKIRHAIAQGYAAEVAAHDDAMAFVRAKYGSWIERALETKAYYVVDANPSEFVVEFTHDDDASAFIKQLGGKEVE